MAEPIPELGKSIYLTYRSSGYYTIEHREQKKYEKDCQLEDCSANMLEARPVIKGVHGIDVSANKTILDLPFATYDCVYLFYEETLE